MLRTAIFAIVGTFVGTVGAAVATAETSWVDKPGKDVTVLQAWLGETVGYQTSRRAFDVHDCAMVTRTDSVGSDCRSWSHHEARCTRSVEEAMRLDGFERASPLLNDFLYRYDWWDQGDQYYPVSAACEIVELRTVIRDAALTSPVFTGVGFYFKTGYSDPGNGGFVAKERLHAVGKVTLVDGTPATVHRFIAKGMCFGTGGNSGSIADRRAYFRPYVQYRVEEGANETIYNVWDDVQSDYLLGRNPQSFGYDFTQSFDRQRELLRH